MTQAELAFAIYRDRQHTTNIYPALTDLTRSGQIARSDTHPAVYSLSGRETPEPMEKESLSPISIADITAKLLEETHNQVMATQNYGREDDLIRTCIRQFPTNTDKTVVAMKIGLIDITNSTNISRYKHSISVAELAERIARITDLDERIRQGDPQAVVEIARCGGKINLFSFASKYCCYHNLHRDGRDDYSIFDSVLKRALPLYFHDISANRIEKWRRKCQYKEYNDYIAEKLDALGIHIAFRRRKFDHFVWYRNR